MSLKKRLERLEIRGEEKKVNLRMQKDVVTLLEKLANHYGTNTSTLIREIIDDAIFELCKDFILLDEENGIEISHDNGKKTNVTYFPDVVELLTGRSYSFPRSEFCSDEERDAFDIKNAEYSVKYGNSYACSGTTVHSKEDYSFESKPYKEDMENIKWQ